MSGDQFGDSGDRTRRNATLGWAIVALLSLLALRQGITGLYRWFFFTGMVIVVSVVPPLALRDPYAVPPWELLALAAIPVLDAVFFGETVVSPVVIYLAVSAVALIVAVDVQSFTTARINRPFAVALVVITTMAVTASWNVSLWIADTMLGTAYLVGGRSQDAANHAMMMDFLYATFAGLLAGVLFTVYLERRSFTSTAGSDAHHEQPDEEPDPAPAFVRDTLGLSEERIRWTSWTLQFFLAVILVYGLVVRDVPTVTSASITLTVSFLPAFLARNYRLTIEPELIIWLTIAVFLHTLGSVGLYDAFDQWDSLTHTLSASVVAATGYTTVRVIDLHSDTVYLPSKTMFVFILLFVLAAGVVWELIEFLTDLAAQQLGVEATLAQYGIDDTVGDLLFNLVGAVITATLGAAYLTGVSYRIIDRFDNRAS